MDKKQLPEGWHTKPLGEILTDQQIADCKEFLKHKNWPGLRAYLEERRTELELKGVDAGYFYYWMINSFGG